MKNNLKANHRTTLLASLGSSLEYYDFIIYGMMATYLAPVFFPPEEKGSAYLQASIIFAVGYFARPFGGTIIGMVGDLFGRRPAFLASTTIMAVCTLAIGCLPSYDVWGVGAAFSLLVLRIMQGVSFGGEIPGAMTIVSEFSDEQHQGWTTSLVLASTSLGAVSASGVLFLLSAILSHEQIITWGWRLPFLLGGALGLILFIARTTLEETPTFKTLTNIVRHEEPLILLLGPFKFSLLRASALGAFMIAMIITNLYFPHYIPQFFGYSANDVFLGTTVSLVFATLVLPITGKIADRLPSKIQTFQWVCALYIPLSIPIFSLLLTGSQLALFLFLIIHQLFIALSASCFYPNLIRIFSADMRYTGIALAYNLAWALLGTLPANYTMLLDFYVSPWMIPASLSGIAAISLIATRGLNQSLHSITTDHSQGTPDHYEIAPSGHVVRRGEL